MLGSAHLRIWDWLVYVDELIYSKADWSDLTGEDANRYWRWSYGAAQPERRQSPPETAGG